MRRAVVAALAFVLCTACSGIPREGPVVVVEPNEEPTSPSVGRFDPAPPEPGSSPSQVVRGFLSAMQAYPVSTDVAREYLTDAASEAWEPTQRTIIYESAAFGEAPGGQVEMQIVERARLGPRGTFDPKIAGQQRSPIQWQLVQEEGEWRIVNPKDRLYIGSEYFETHYSSYNLYFLDPAQRIAVGEPAYFPTGEQLATNLVRALLVGPSAETAPYVRTAIPTSARLEVAIPVGEDGVAEVRLTGPDEQLSELQAELLSVQIVSTLRQVPGVLGVRIVLNEKPVDVGGLTDVQDVTTWDYYRPAASLIERQLFALAEGRLVSVEGAFVGEINAPVGQQAQELRWVVVRESTGQVLGVSRDGRRIMSGSFETGSAALVPAEVTGTDLGRPSQDPSGAVVVVDRSPAGSSLVVVDRLGTAAARRVGLGSLASSYVHSLSISPDGVRFVAVVSASDAPAAPTSLVTGWITRRRGGVSGVAGVRPLTIPGEQFAEVRDAGWAEEGTVALLGRFAGAPFEVYTVNIDGSGLSGGRVSGEPLPEELEPVALATAGLADAPIYALGRDGILWLYDDDAEWRVVAGAERVRSPTFAR